MSDIIYVFYLFFGSIQRKNLLLFHERSIQPFFMPFSRQYRKFTSFFAFAALLFLLSSLPPFFYAYSYPNIAYYHVKRARWLNVCDRALSIRGYYKLRRSASENDCSSLYNKPFSLFLSKRNSYLPLRRAFPSSRSLSLQSFSVLHLLSALCPPLSLFSLCPLPLLFFARFRCFFSSRFLCLLCFLILFF